MAGPEVLRPFLDRTLRVGIKDGRKLTGRFKCTDHDANVILASAVERMPGSEGRFWGVYYYVDDTCLRRCRRKRRTAFSRLGDDSRTLHSQYRIESQGGRGCGIEDDRALVSGERRDVSSSSRRRRREERHRNIATIRIINTTVLIK